ncbi:MAG: response regulator [Candidatus Latescibacterota bacterium]|jgi:two-component system chemotaxis response regulator CheV
MEDHEGILLETGTNEVEILELLISAQLFGVNVLKIKQILSYSPDGIAALHAPGIHPAVKGVFLFHGKPILLTDLGQYLFPDKEPAETTAPQVIVVCEFNNAQQGFLIDGVDRIIRRSWDQIQAPNGIFADAHSMITGIVSSEGHEVLLIDFEGIIDDVSGGSELIDAEESTATEDLQQMRATIKVLMADDSSMVRHQVSKILRTAGYANLAIFDNGADAYMAINSSTEQPFDVVVTDIEMPQLDGLTLCRKLKENHSQSKVIIFSSMISEQVAIKCRSVGADAYLSKEQTHELPTLIDTHILSLASTEAN